MFVSVLERFYQANGLIDGSADRQIVDCDLADNSFWIDDEKSTQSDATILEENSIIIRDLLCQI